MKRILSLLCLVCPLVCAPALGVEKPNILWIFIEDMSPWLGCYGDEVNKDATPTIDTLAKSGVKFTHCYVPCPVCSPCRSAMITGAYQTTNGFHNHRSSRGPKDSIPIPDGVTTVPQIFQKHGYATFNIGKDDYNFDYDRKDLYTYIPGKKDVNTQTPWRGCGDKPFFGQIQLRGGKSNPKGIKNPVDLSSIKPPAYFPNNELFRTWHAHHYDTIRQTDLDTKAVLDRLRADGLLENTIIFWFTDHGNNHSLRAKQFCTESGTHVPLIITGPWDQLKPGTTRDDLVSLLDVSATSLAAAGIRVPEYFQGEDLFGGHFTPRRYVISARDRCDYTIDHIRTVRTKRYRYIRNFKTDRPLLQPQYRDGQPYTKFLRQGHAEGSLPKITEEIFFGPRPAEELYDLEKDPHEINNLATNPKFADEVKYHREILNKWIEETDDKGQYPESQDGLYDVLKQWGNRCVNPEYDALKAKYPELANAKPSK